MLKPPPCLIKEDTLSLPGEALIELVRAVHEKDKPFRLSVGGCSMSPFLKNGDIITIAPRQKVPVRFGDVVAFVHPLTEKPLVHRVISKKGCFLKIRGDNALIEDGLIPEANILGRITRVERNGENVYLGLGIERYLIALLSGRSLLTGFISGLSGFRKIFRNSLHRVLA